MALGTFVAGRASGTYDPPGAVAAADLGIMEGGYEISARVGKELIGETDAHGLAVIDAIYRGYSDVAIQMTPIEWLTPVLAALFPYGAVIPVTGAGYLGPGVIGRLDSDIAGILILTAAAGTPAATKPASVTATYTIIHESFDVKVVLDSKLRKMPARFRVYPYLDTVTKYMTYT